MPACAVKNTARQLRSTVRYQNKHENIICDNHFFMYGYKLLLPSQK